MVNPEASLPFLRLLNVPGVGWGRVRRLLEWSDQHNMRIDEVVEDIAALRQTLTEPQVEAVRGSTQAAQRVLDGLVERDVSLIAVTDERYPERINTLLGVKAPPLLAVLGNQELLTAVSVGFCGSRKSGLSIVERDGGALHHGAFGIADGAAQRSCCRLSADQNVGGKEKPNQ